MGLEHNFLYVSPDRYYDELYKKIRFHPLRIDDTIISEMDYVDIHDDIILYFYDYFEWLKLYNPCTKEYVNGLCYHGVTTISNDALFQLKKIIDGLLMIFSNAPDMIQLRGSYIISDNCYEKMHIKKEKIANTFNRLNQLLERAIQENGFIVHLGI